MLKLNNLSKSFYQVGGPKSIIKDLSLEVKKGQVFGFLGINGAGKTTTVKMVAGLLFPDEGKIIINGQSAADPSSRAQIGFMPETPRFHDHLKVWEVLNYAAELFGDTGNINERITRLLKQVDLTEARNLPAHKMSKGMHQRLALAVALVNDPQLLVLDEPLDGLDPLGRLDFKKLLLSLKKEGKTIFFSSHILSDVEEVCDVVAIVHRGKIIRQGSPKELIGKSHATLEEFFVATVRGSR